jgi:hypothetical protein
LECFVEIAPGMPGAFVAFSLSIWRAIHPPEGEKLHSFELQKTKSYEKAIISLRNRIDRCRDYDSTVAYECK